MKRIKIKKIERKRERKVSVQITEKHQEKKGGKENKTDIIKRD